MPRRRKISTILEDEDDFGSENKCGKEDLDSRAPRNAANARERARMRVLSKAFCRLKTTLPWVPADTKLSKLDTLRLAATYIAHLRAVLKDDGDANPDSTRSLSLTLSWPFAIQNAISVPAMLRNSNTCSVSSTSTTCSSPNQYRSQQTFHDIQNYNQIGYPPNLSIRQNHESHLTYY